MRLTIDSRRVGDLMVMKCAGRIVAGEEASQLQGDAKRLIADGWNVVIALADVTFLDSAGLGALVRLVTSARTSGRDIKLCALSGPIRNVLKLTNTLQLFEVFESEDEAISVFHSRGAAAKRKATEPEFRILCLDDSLDVLAYLRELLSQAGYKAITSGNLHDALTLLRATGTNLVVLGPNVQSARGTPAINMLQNFDAKIPVVLLDGDFSQQEAGEAGRQLLQTIRARLRS